MTDYALVLRLGAAPSPSEWITNDADFTLALEAAALSGGEILLDPAGTFAPGRVFNQTPLFKLWIKSGNGSPVHLRDIKLGGCQKICFEHIDFGDDTTRNGDCVTTTANGNSTDCEFWYCDFYGQELKQSDNYGNYTPSVPGPDQPNRRGISSSGGSSYHSGIIVRYCNFSDLADGMKASGWRGRFDISNNHFQRCYSDCIQIGWNKDIPPLAGSRIAFNRARDCWGRNTDYQNPHCDFLQMTVGGTTETSIFPGCLIYGNAAWDSPTTRGTFQGHLISDADSGSYQGFKIAHELRVCRGVSPAFVGDPHAITVSQTSGSYLHNNICARAVPGEGSGGAAINVYSYPGRAPTFIGSNIAEAFSITGLWTQDNDNRVLANTVEAYAANFDGSVFPATTWEELFAAFKRKTGDPLRDAVDYEAQTYDPTLEPSRVEFGILEGATAGEATPSGLRQLFGGGEGQAISITGGEYRTATDADGTGLTGWTSSPGVFDEFTFFEVQGDASGDPSGLHQVVLTVSGQANAFSIITASSAAFDVIDNDATAFTTISTPSSVAGHSKLFLGIRFKWDAANNVAQSSLVSAAGTTFFFDRLPRGTALRSQMRFQLVGGLMRASQTGDVDTNWHTALIAVDFTKTDPNQVFKWYIDGYPQAYTGNVSALGTQTFNQNSIMNALALFAKSAGTQIADARNAFVYLDFGGSGFDLLDPSDPAVYASFFPDNINGGLGPSGSEPKFYITGSAAEHNAGLTGLGSLNLTSTPTGTFT